MVTERYLKIKSGMIIFAAFHSTLPFPIILLNGSITHLSTNEAYLYEEAAH